MAEAQEEVDHDLRLITLLRGFVVIEVNKAKTQTKEVDYPPVRPDKLGFGNSGIPHRIEIFDDSRHFPNGVASLYLGAALRARKRQFGAYRTIFAPEKGEEPVVVSIVVEGGFFKPGQRQAGFRAF